MGFSDDYFELKKKKKKETEQKTTGHSYTDEYQKLKAERVTVQEKTEDIAPVVSTTSKKNAKEEEDTNFWDLLGSHLRSGIFLASKAQSGVSLTENDWDVAKEMQESRLEKLKQDRANGLTWFQKGALEDGVNSRSVSKAILGTSADAVEDFAAGIVGMGEKVVDALAMVAPDINRAMYYQNSGGYVSPQHQKALDEVTERSRAELDKFVEKDLYDESDVAKKIVSGLGSAAYMGAKAQNGGIITERDWQISQQMLQSGMDYVYNEMEGDSVFGTKTDSLVQSGGQLAATATLNAAGLPWWVTTGLTSFGAEAENALQQGATHEEAFMSATISAGAEILTEKLSGGIKFGGKTLDDALTKQLGRTISNKVLRFFAKTGVDMAGEGTEEVISQLFSNLGSSLYREENLSEILFSEEALDEYLESYVGGFLLGGTGSVTQSVNANRQGIDAVTGLTKNEQAVVDKVYNDRVAEAEENGKISEREKSKIYDRVLEDMENGYISTDTIEEILGGETYKTYKDTVDSEDTLYNEFEELGKKQNATLAEQARYAELSQKVREIESNSQRNQLKNQLGLEVSELVKGDRLVESYNERGRKSQAFTADLSQYDTKYHDTIKKAAESGILNNTNRTHQFVDMIAKISADKGVLFDFTNNARLKESGFAVDGAEVNGFVTKDGITLNIDSAKAWQSTVGHEITHVLEGTEVYDVLKQTIFDYAKSKGEYQSRYDTLAKLYKNVEDADIDAELTADLVGDYLFQDSDFINKLSTEHRNVFQKIYDEIKYLYKVATAGSKEARELERVKRAFDKAYKESGKVEGTKYSISDENDVVVYHGSKEKFDSFDFSRLNDELGVFFSESEDGAKHYGNANAYHLEPRKTLVVHQGEEYRRLLLTGETDAEKRSRLVREGFDTIKLVYNKPGDGETIEWVALTPDVIKYSLSDSDGKQLTKEQQEYFRDSKMRDENGNLKVMYHGSQDAGFHVFDARMSDDDTSFFFVDRNDVAASYSGTTETYEAKSFRSAEDANKFFAEIGKPEYEVVEQDGKYTLYDDGDEVATSESLSEIYDEFRDWEGVGYGDANYKVYLNLTNPLEVDAEGRNWDNVTREFSQEVYEAYQSLTETEKEHLTQLASWEDVSVFRDEILDAVDGDPTEEYAQAYVSVYNKLGGKDADLNNLFAAASEGFTAEAIRENAVKRLKTRDYATKAKAEGYDGVIFKNIVDVGGYGGDYTPSTVAIAFDSNQIKSVANDKPTGDKDIRFSLSEPVEQTKDLMALHNLTEQKLLKSLQLGGLPMPSVAIAKAKDGHGEFGEISLILPRETIDPKESRNNKLYSGDAWTPTYPMVDYKPNKNVLWDIDDKISALVPYEIQKELGSLMFDTDNASNYLSRYNGNMVEAYKQNDAMKYAYLKDTGSDISLPMKEADLYHYGGHSNAAVRYFSGKLVNGLQTVELYRNMSASDLLQDKALTEAIADAQNFDVLRTMEPGSDEYLEYERNPAFLAEEVSFRDIDNFLSAARKLFTNGIQQTVDRQAAKELIRDTVDQAAYESWLEELFSGVVEKEGIRNNKDYFTPSGNRRSFEALHYEHNLENVIKAMREKGEKGIGNGFGGASIFGASTTEFSSIEEMKQSSDRLQTMSYDEYQELRKGFTDRFLEIAMSLPNQRNSFSATDSAAEVLTEAVAKYKTRSGIANYLRRELNGWATYSDQAVDDLIELVGDIRNMPTGYFEAKPQRAVSFDEVGVFVIPNNADVKLKQELLNRGYAIAEYDPNIEGHRQQVVNQFEEYKFSLSNVGEQSKRYGSFATPARALRLEEEIAPVQEVAEETASEVDETPVSYLGALYRDKANLERRMMEQVEQGDIESLKATKTEWENLSREMDEELAAMQSETLDSLTDADAPVEQPMEQGEVRDQVTMPKSTVSMIAQNVKSALGVPNNQMGKVHKLIEDYAMQEFPSREQLFQELQDNFGTYTEVFEEEELRAIKKWLRKYPLAVSDTIKGDIADYGAFRRQNFGKVQLVRNGLPVDVAYMELQGIFPGYFPEGITNPTDQLMQIVNLANASTTTARTQEVDAERLWSVADDIIEQITDYQQVQREQMSQRAARDTLDTLASEYAPIADDDIAPVKETVAPVEETAEKPSTTAQETKAAVAAKIENFRQELTENERLREKSNADFDAEIAKMQGEYDAKANKNTIAANDILRRIKRMQRMKNSVDGDYAKRIENIQSRIDKMSQQTYQTAAQRYVKQGEYAKQMEELIGDTTTWVDKKLGLSYKVNTLRRNLRDIIRDSEGNRDIEKADAIYDELQGKYNHNEAMLNRESNQIKKPYADMKITAAEDAYIQMLGELRHNPDTTLTKEKVDEFYQKHKNSIDEAKVDKVIADARETYDTLLQRVNEVLREQGMKEIPYRKGYFPHFTEDKQSFLAKLFNWKVKNNDIPTDIAGLTEQFNPNRSWQSFNKERKGDTTDYSFKKGLDTYVQGALDWIYHIEDIQKRRAFENHIRYVHSEKGVQEKIDAIRKSEEYDADEMQEQIDLVLKEAGNPLNNFVTDFRTGTNTLANKKSSMDRGMEEMVNRKVYSVMTNISSRVSANMVAGSVSSALTNFIPITQSWGQVSPIYSLRAMGETIRSTIHDDGTIDKSDFLINRLRKSENLYKTTWDKIGDAAGLMMESIDGFTSQVVWRSKYQQNISKGMSESEAIKNADQFAENVLAGRSRGNQPTIFDSKNPLIKICTAFQLEVNNQYGYMFKDMPQDMRNEAVGKLVKGYATMFLGAYAYNALYSSLTGRDSAFDPIGIIEDLLRDFGLFGDDDEEEPVDILMGLVENIFEEVPFVGGLMGGGRIPISSAFPYDGNVMDMIKGTTNAVAEKDWGALAEEWLNPVYYLALPVGGGQLRKTNQGLSMFSDDHPVAGSYTNSGALRFPVDDTLGSKIKAGIFGQWANKNAQDYLDNGRTPLQEKQIQEFLDVGMSIQDYWNYREGLSGLSKLSEKADYINSLDLTDEQKNILINNIADRKEDIDMSDYDDYDTFEEFDFATKNPEKYSFLQENNVTYKQYEAFDDDTKGAYDWAFKNPEKFTVSKAISDNFLTYYHYKSDLNDLEADKDENGKSISGSKKEKVIDYINGLDIDYGQRIILFRSMYDSKADQETYNSDIVDYLNSRDDISYGEMETILKELGFTVDSDGNISW